MHFHHFAGWSKLRYGVHLAAALVHLMHRQRDAHGLVTFDETIRTRIPARSSSRHQRLIFDALEQLLEAEQQESKQMRRSGTADLIHQLADSLEKRSMVILISDLFENVKGHEELISALKHLRRNHHEVLVFQLLEDRSERQFAFTDGDLLLQDMETGDDIVVDPVQLRQAYRDRAEEHVRLMRSACSENRIDFVEIDTEQSFAKALLAWLSRRKRFR